MSELELLIKECEYGGPPLYSYDGEWWYDTAEEAKVAVECPGIITG